MSEIFYGAVFYTDGGCRPNPGFMGSGGHGYIYTTSGKKTKAPPKHYTTTHGYVESKDLIRGEVEEAFPTSYINFFTASTVQGTNNQAELEACYQAFVEVAKLLKTLDHTTPFKYLRIYTDSKYVVRGMTEWYPIWVKNNWRQYNGDAVKNQDRWKELLAQIDHYRELGCVVEISHVKGHNDNFGNTLSDYLATVGVMNSIANNQVTDCRIYPAESYWRHEFEPHPFLSMQKTLYFNSQATEAARHQYHLADSVKDNHTHLKKSPGAGYSLVRISDEVDPVIETVKLRHGELCGDYDALVSMKLERLFHWQVYSFIKEYGRHAIVPTNRSLSSLEFVDKRPLSHELYPPGEAYRLVQTFSFLETTLDECLSYLGNINKQSGRLSLIKITDHFFEKKLVKKKELLVLKPEFAAGTTDTSIPCRAEFDGSIYNLIVPLAFGRDILNRNNLKRLESFEPEIYLVIWRESAVSCRYGTVILTKNAVGIWSNFYSDRIILPPTS